LGCSLQWCRTRFWNAQQARGELCRRFDDFVREAQLVIEPVTEDQARLAREAYRDFGRGSGHPARLNFGDCFAYALAKASNEPLLFKGDDFAQTNVTPAPH
jgi:ribonuclease VapC